jgi:hypothetical protein
MSSDSDISLYEDGQNAFLCVNKNVHEAHPSGEVILDVNKVLEHVLWHKTVGHLVENRVVDYLINATIRTGIHDLGKHEIL